MAFLQVDFFSETFGMSMNMNVILPQEIQVPNPVNGGRFPKPYPVMYLLHGWNGDHTVWERRTSIERYAAQTGIAIVMPAVHLSFYSDMACGLPYWTYLSQELPNVCGQMFPQLSTRREDTWAAGLSMVGYGAETCPGCTGKVQYRGFPLRGGGCCLHGPPDGFRTCSPGRWDYPAEIVLLEDRDKYFWPRGSD